MKTEVQIFGIALLIIVPLGLIWGAWYYIFNPMIKQTRKSGETITLKHYLLFTLMGITFLIVGFLFFYLNGYWKLLPFSVLITFYFFINR